MTSKKVFEQGTFDSLCAAKRALDRAIEAYEKCRGAEAASTDEGALFATLDNLDTVIAEVDEARSILKG